MHLLATRPGGYAAGDGVVDLGQTPAEVVILSAADTDLALLADAAERTEPPFSLRLANLLALRSNASVDLYFDRVLSHAKLVVVAMMGGVGYWPYGVDRLVERAREREPHALELVLVPGDDTPDPELARLSTVGAADCARIWRYLREGGPSNASALIRFLGARFFDAGPLPNEPEVMPRTVVYHPEAKVADRERWRREWREGAPVAALLFYRAHLQAGNLSAFDALIAELARAGFNALPIAVASLKDSDCRAAVETLLRDTRTEIVLNTTGFAVSGFEGSSVRSCTLGLDRPVLQVILSGGNVSDWRGGSTGLSPRDLAMSVVLPETDGRIISRAVSFKGARRRSLRAEADVVEYQVEPDRVRFVAELAARWVRLARTPTAKRRIALVLANYPAEDGRLGNGVGLDTPASTVEILRGLERAGYGLAEVPDDGAKLMDRLRAQVTNELGAIDTRRCLQSLSLDDYAAFLRELPPELGRAIDARWGRPEDDPRCRDGRLMISGIELGNAFVGVQPSRGYSIDVQGTYHDPDLVPPHGYVAFYAWLRRAFAADAVVHVGKHGNLEWLPGKSVALGSACWPDAVFGPLPHLYPFIVNDPGEGTQAKRRAQAVIIDHLVPPLTRAETYGVLRDLERLVDEFYQALTLDPPRAQLLRREILSVARRANLERELTRAASRRARPEGNTDDALLVSIDAYLCELKESQIRDGLHVFGRSPAGVQRLDTLVALSRVSVGNGAGRNAGLLGALAKSLLGADLPDDAAAPWSGQRPEELARVSEDAWRTVGDTRERLELFARALLAGEVSVPVGCSDVVERVRDEIVPALDACGPCEMAGLLAGLDGRFVEPGPSGAPTRGRLDVLPTGRNFYSVDVRAVPTPSAFHLAKRAAERLVERHVQDHGEYPRCIGLSVWGTATMRTGGDDVAQALALLGVRPVWAEGSARVVDTEVLPASALRRPRVDVVLRISGFFRDAFPELIRLLDAAVRAVAELDEPESVNPIRARVLADEARLRAEGLVQEEAARKARFRIFGSKPGAYGTGIGDVLGRGDWRDRSDLADVYLNFGCYAYATAEEGAPERELLQNRLSGVDAVVQNQDNREHDILDSDDYYQFQGGMGAAVEQARGALPALYHGDHADPAAPRVRSLQEELARVIRSRVVNPKWILGARRHGFKGAAEMAATVDFLFGYGAATGIVEDYQYALVTDAYLMDPENRAFLAEHNPGALRTMTERLLEAMERGLWREPREQRGALEALLLDVEER
ncbi:MAG TPA: cobaltochelatase subunit CobN [Polyangiaceae bacterium]|nr:cobaltochelatase subunit CobN [Polyangiaceae bacterium]